MDGFILVTLFLLIALIQYFRSTRKPKAKKFVPTPDIPGEPVKSISEKDWEAKLKTTGLHKYWAKLQALLRNEILIVTSEKNEDKMKIGKSKVGGRPDLPRDQGWFREDNGTSLSFLAQINCAETKSFDLSGQLPDKGIIYFFYSATQEAWGFDPKDIDKFKVFFFEGEPGELERKDYPEDLMDDARFDACEVRFIPSTSLPHWESPLLNDVLHVNDRDAYIDLFPENPITKLLGHANSVQGPMEEECQLVTNGFFCGDSSGYNDPRAQDLRKDSDQWVLLFQLDSISDSMMWFDYGKVYFWIRKDDLRDRRFDKCWFVLQSY